jgi:transcriptional regulator with XRE-family HTH domain
MEVSDNPSPAVQRRRLRAELRRARLGAGLTQEQVAKAMDWSLSKLIRIENGTTAGISTNDLKAILLHYNITDEARTAEFVALARASRERSWWSAYRDVAPPRLIQLIDYEEAASTSLNYQSLLVPGMLQTAEYARAAIEQLAPDMPASQVAPRVEIRMKRQELLNRADAPLMFFVMDEGVVRRLVGGKDVMRQQLQRMIDLANMPKVTVEIVPFSAGVLSGMEAPFVIHEFPDGADDDVLYQEIPPRNDLLSRDNPEEVLAFRESFERLREASLRPDGTIDFLRELVNSLL